MARSARKAVQKWLLERYSRLWNNFGKKRFSFEEAESVLNENSVKRLSMILGDLRRSGWLTVELDPSTSRKRLYKLKEPSVIIKSIGKS